MFGDLLGDRKVEDAPVKTDMTEPTNRTDQSDEGKILRAKARSYNQVDNAYHPIPGLLSMSCDQILGAYQTSQLMDVSAAFSQSALRGDNLASAIDLLDRYFAVFPSEAHRRRINTSVIEGFFKDLHSHVMAHPVWTHPVFRKFSDGEVTLDQLRVFSLHYFNQVKNTRQCVALALGRFHSMVPDVPDGNIDNAFSELTQVVLAGLLADEYGFADAARATNNFSELDIDQAKVKRKQVAVDIESLFSPVTHPALYRRFLVALGVAVADYDAPMLHAVADNVLVQRILSGDRSYDHIEALASVGMGMEWGVPAFFSMIIAGILKLSQGAGIELDANSMEIWSAHVRQDVAHAVAVMLVTAFFVRDQSDIGRIKYATNALMAFRYEMMSEIHEEVFGMACPRVDHIELPRHYLLRDSRLLQLLPAARIGLRASAIRNYPTYINRTRFPRIIH